MAAKLRVGVLLGILVVFAPPAGISLETVLHRTENLTHAVDPVEIGKTGDRPLSEGSPNGRQEKSPTPSAPPDDPVSKQIATTLNQQAAALLGGDLPGFLAPVDPANTQLRQNLTQRFASLRAMRVATWSETAAGRPSTVAGGLLAVAVKVRYCFAVPTCATTEISVQTTWSKVSGTQLRLMTFDSSTADSIGPRPWEVSELQAVVGNRVIVAGTKRWASRLQGVLTSAERAASVTDRYARWGSQPSRYVVFLAGPDEWSKWYGTDQANWVAAYAMPLSPTYTEIVLNALKVGSTDSREVLQHEFTHVVTLSGVQRSYPNTWWLIEGIAEYVQNVGQPVMMYRALSDGRRYVRGGWNGSVVMGDPPAEASSSEANGRYAVAYLTVHRLVERFGEPRMLEFFNAVARGGGSLESSSPSAFGQPWQQVADDCSRYVRRTVGA
jgi:hypothetical protein